jgi:hypothetical protein
MGCIQQKRQLGRWISAEVADASCLFVHCSNEAFNRFVLALKGVVPEMPVLAIEAVKCASMGKNREVAVAVFCTFL